MPPALIAALGYQRAHVFGTSFGGVIAQVLAVRHPERIDRLVLSSTFRPGAPLPSINPEFPRFAELRSRLPDSIGEFAKFFFTPDYLAGHPEALSVFAGNKRTDEQKARRGAVIPRPISVDLGRITAPTLVLVGAEDRLIPPAHTLSLAREISRRKDRDHSPCWPCRHAARPRGGGRGRKCLSARGQITTKNHGGGRPWPIEGRISSRCMTARR